MCILFFLFLIGVFFGSFLNVVIDRLPRGETIFVGRSHCEYCHHPLAWYDLVPLFSFLFLFGKCRYCHTDIGWKYPLIELTTGIGFVCTYMLLQYASFPLIFTTLVLVSCCIVVFYTDFFYGIIPDSILCIFFLFGLLRAQILSENIPFFLLSGIGVGLFFLLLFLLTRGRGIGFGDVKYAFVMGFLLGFPYSIPALYISFLTGASVALILVMTHKKAFTQTIALGPFLVLGTVINIFFSTQVWTIFQKILGI